ncbi:hypothetical protein C1645_877892 [Glomus cerebriforme]|uniref:Uncharacterized protein n=1 Tax=Glomus cerebriforme TaxID=658196 RepID=A0A397SXP0_9GLOM|nr:hypothetical protein C1645_877892 [Glomus cerebriforme]
MQEKKGCPEKSSIAMMLKHLVHLYNKAINAEDGANSANQEEILCYNYNHINCKIYCFNSSLYRKDFRVQLNGIIKDNSGKFEISLDNHVTEISETVSPGKIYASLKNEVSVTTTPIPITHVSNSSDEFQIEKYDEGDYYEDDDIYDEGCYYEDKGYYYHDGRYERKVSPMTSPSISPVYA